MRVLLLEDHEPLARGIAKALRDAGHAVDCLADGLAGDDFLRVHGADLAIIDVNLPGLNGFDVTRAMRRRRDSTPVLILTARSETHDRVTGLDAGADDYLTKPFEMDELAARVRALGRRRGNLTPMVEKVGTLEFDRAGRRLWSARGPVELPRRELALFEILLDHAGRVASKEDIAERLYGTGAETDVNAVELLVSRLRRKLAGLDIAIRTVRGLGYLLETEPDR